MTTNHMELTLIAIYGESGFRSVVLARDGSIGVTCLDQRKLLLMVILLILSEVKSSLWRREAWPSGLHEALLTAVSTGLEEAV